MKVLKNISVYIIPTITHHIAMKESHIGPEPIMLFDISQHFTLKQYIMFASCFKQHDIITIVNSSFCFIIYVLLEFFTVN